MSSVFVPGVPAPQGSKRHVGRGVMVESSKAVGPWRERLALAVAAELNGKGTLGGPVALSIVFRLQRPLGHYGTGRNEGTLRAAAPALPAVRPDLDKLLRAVLDALTGVVYADDCQVVEVHCAKVYADGSPGVHITWARAGLPKGA